MGLYPQQNTTASGVTSLNELLLAHVDHDFLINLPLLYHDPPCPSVPLPSVDDDICLYLMLKYIDPAVAELREVLVMRPDSEEPALLAAFVLFSTLAKLAKGARILDDHTRATANLQQPEHNLNSAAEQGGFNEVNTDISVLSDLNIDPLIGEGFKRSKDFDSEMLTPESPEQSGFCLSKRLEPKKGCQADPLLSSVATHLHVGSSSPALEYNTRCYQAISYGVDGALKNSELGYHGPVMVSFGDHLGLHLVKVQELRSDKERKRWLGPLAPSDKVFEAWKKEQLVEKASSNMFKLEKVEEGDGEVPFEEQSFGGAKWRGKGMGTKGGVVNLTVVESPPKRQKRQRSSLPSNSRSTEGLPNIQFRNRPPQEERRLFEISSLGFFSTWTQCGDPVQSIVGLLKHLCHQNCPEAITGGLLGARKCLDAFEEEERRRATKRARPFVGSLERTDLLKCKDVDAMCELLIKEAMEERNSKKT